MFPQLLRDVLIAHRLLSCDLRILMEYPTILWGAMAYYAHSAPVTDEGDWQELATHALLTAELASKFAASFGGEKAAYLSGVMHDLGKYNPDFLAYIRGHLTEGGKGPDHSTDGAGILLRRAAGTTNAMDRAILELLAHVVAGHHSGLPDRRRSVDPGSKDGLQERVEQWDASRLDPAWKNEINPEFSALFPPAFRADPRLAKANPAAARAFQIVNGGAIPGQLGGVKAGHC